MTKYLKYLELGFLDSLYYRTNNILTFMSSFLIDYVKVAIWVAAVVAVPKRVEQGVMNDTITYMVFAASLSAIFRVEPNNSLSSTYLQGTLIHRLIYPISIPTSHFFDVLGKTIARFFTNSLPSLLILTYVFGAVWPIRQVGRVPIVITNLLLAVYMNFLLYAMIDVLCFWVQEPASLQKLKDIVVKLLSGALLPLWFFPESFNNILIYFPFSKMLYAPIAYLLGTIVDARYYFEFRILCIWCVGLTLAFYILWRKGIQRVHSYGG